MISSLVPAYDYQRRLARLRGEIQEASFDAVLITEPENVRYLTGLLGHSDFDVVLLITAETTYVLTNDLYREAFCRQSETLELPLLTGRLTGELGRLAAQHDLRKIGFEPKHLSVAILERLQAIDNNIAWAKGLSWVETARNIKDAEELAQLSEACRLTDLALEKLLPEIQIGRTECGLAEKLRRIVFDMGGDGLSFDPIIAVGANASKPHHTPGEGVVTKNTLLQFDLGVRKAGYGGDLSRVAVLGNLSPRDQHVVDVVLAAQQLAIDGVACGVDGRELDQLTKTFITNQGLPAFTHGLGHGIGLDVHEAPTLHQDIAEPVPLAIGMVFTIEPGIYLPGELGVRIEDVVTLIERGLVRLSNFPRRLIQL